MERYKVYNDRRFDIGLTMPNGTERVVKAGGYTLLTVEEMEHVCSIAPAMFAGERLLRLENRKLAVELGFILDEAIPVLNDAEIRKQLAQRPAQLKAWLDTVQEPYFLEDILQVAVTMDLPASKLQVLQDRVPDKALIQQTEPGTN